MRSVLEPGRWAGIVRVPPSKSLSQRAFAAALLHRGSTTIRGAGDSEDERAALAAVRALGATVRRRRDGALQLSSRGVRPVQRSIILGESGLAARLFTPIAALAGEPVTLSGKGSLPRRPMPQLAEGLAQLDVLVSGFTGHLPITVCGPLQPRDCHVNGSAGSQVVSGLLFALSAVAQKPLTLHLQSATSKPYLDLTLQVLAHFGRPLANDGYQRFHIDPALFSQPDAVSFKVESDWSSAAAFLVAGAIGGAEIGLAGLSPQSLQADKALLGVLETAGARIEWDEAGLLRIIPPDRLRSFSFDATDAPDLFPVLAVLAAAAEGSSTVSGLHRLVHKESNRAESIGVLLSALGIASQTDGDVLRIEGRSSFRACTVSSFNDHRIAMAAAVASLRAEGPLVIEGAEAVAKSYPAFFEDVRSLGAVVRSVDGQVKHPPRSPFPSSVRTGSGR